MTRVKKILAPTDFTEISKAGIRYALEMAREASAEVVVYHAIEVGGEWKDNPPKVTAYHDMLKESRQLLDKFITDNFADCIDLVEVRYSVEFGTPHKNIVEKAADEGRRHDRDVDSWPDRCRTLYLGQHWGKGSGTCAVSCLNSSAARAGRCDGRGRLMKGMPVIHAAVTS